MAEFNEIVKAAAARLGVTKPALVYLHVDSEHAAAIKNDIERGPITAEPWPTPTEGEVYLMGAHDASRLLRLRCLGGSAVADKIDADDGASWTFLNVGVLPDAIEVYAMRGDKESFYASSEVGQPG